MMMMTTTTATTTNSAIDGSPDNCADSTNSNVQAIMDDDLDTTASGSIGGRNGSSSISINSDGLSTVPNHANNGGGGGSRTTSSATTTSTTTTASTPTVQLPDRYGFTGGSQYTRPETIKTISAEVVRKRELKWLDMIENWDKYMTKKYKKVRERCRKGIPPSLRARAWQHLCGATSLLEQNKHKFCELESQPGDPRYIEDIRKDLHRQFPFHEMFMNREGHGQEDLFRILKAFTVLNPVDGYCQAQAPIAAILLMHMPAEHAFWCLVSICDKYLAGYYSQGLEAIQMDGEILYGLVKKVSPQVHKQLKKQHIEPVLYMTEWFMCVFTRTLPWSSVLRIWDMFFCEGVKIMFRVALVLMKFSLGHPDTLKRCPTMYETLEILRNIPGEIMQEDFLVDQMMRIGVNEIDMENEHAKQIARQRALRDKKLKRIKGKS